MKLYHPPVDLDAPKQPGEVEYTTLQLSRLRRSAINFQNFVIAALVMFLLGGGVAVWAAWKSDQAIVDARTEARYRECVRDNERSAKAVAKERKSAEVLIAAARRVPVEQFHTIQLTPIENKYIADQIAGAREIYPPRKCDTASIDAYYENDAK